MAISDVLGKLTGLTQSFGELGLHTKFGSTTYRDSYSEDNVARKCSVCDMICTGLYVLPAGYHSVCRPCDMCGNHVQGMCAIRVPVYFAQNVSKVEEKTEEEEEDTMEDDKSLCLMDPGDIVRSSKVPWKCECFRRISLEEPHLIRTRVLTCLVECVGMKDIDVHEYIVFLKHVSDLVELDDVKSILYQEKLIHSPFNETTSFPERIVRLSTAIRYIENQQKMDSIDLVEEVSAEAPRKKMKTEEA
jgi:hypothetical protein